MYEDAVELMGRDEDNNVVTVMRRIEDDWAFARGHHAGRMLSEVPSAYLEWIDREGGVTDYSGMENACFDPLGTVVYEELARRGWPWGIVTHEFGVFHELRKDNELCPCGRSLVADDTLWYMAIHDQLALGLRAHAICPSCGWHWCCEGCGWVEKRDFM